MRVFLEKKIQVFAILIVGLLLASGCSGLSMKYGSNADEDGIVPNEDGMAMAPDKFESHANRSEASGTSGGVVHGTQPSLHSYGVDSGEVAGGHPEMSTERNAAGSSGVPAGTRDVPGGANYGHDYAGVDGSGPDHGSVSGFRDGLASTSRPDPESWAEANLGSQTPGRELNGSLSPNGTSSPVLSTEEINPALESNPASKVNPKVWAEKYVKEHGGPSPEYVDPDLSVAHANGRQARGGEGIGPNLGDGHILQSTLGSHREGPMGNVQDIYFAFDSWSISPHSAEDLREGAKWLQANPEKILTIEGHCDQRGTQDYNLVLGQKRAEAAREYLIDLGVHSYRINIVSYGKERPFCQTQSEECFHENRRNHMVVRIN